MANFRPRSQDELAKLDDEALLSYIALSRAQGTPEHTQNALAVIVFRYHGDIERRVRIKLPEADVEDVAQEAMVSAIRSQLDGRSVGEFRTWLNRIVSRRIADYWRRRETDLDTTALAEEHSDDDEIWGETPRAEDERGLVEVQGLIDTALAELSDQHAMVVDLFVLRGHSAEETCDDVNREFPDERAMRIDNVSKIAERFRRRLRELLSDAEREPEPHDPDDEDPDNPT